MQGMRHWILAGLLIAAITTVGEAANYAVVVSKATRAKPGWQEVVETLANKHQGEIIVYEGRPDEALAKLKALFPQYTCFVATPDEAGKEFVERVHRMTRRLDDDPYTDTSWGIVTGYAPQAALRIAKQSEPLTVRNVAAGTEVALDLCESGRYYNELKPGRVVVKAAGEKPKVEDCPVDTTKALADALADADLFVTSGHATEHDWQIGFGYRNGQFRCKDGTLYGLDTKGNKHDIKSAKPKVYLAVGNCLMGHVDGKDCMALAWMNSAGVDQMVGYTDLTWFGYGGWGLLDYFVEQPGRFTLAEAFLANQHALVNRLESGEAGGDARGLEYDRDIVLRRPGLGGPHGRRPQGVGPDAQDRRRRVHAGNHPAPRRVNLSTDQHERVATRRAADHRVSPRPRA
jgi:zinc protease